MSEQSEIKELLQELVNQKNKEPVVVKHDLIDSLSKVGVAICVAGILWVGSQMLSLTTSVAIIKTQVEDFESFTEEPRFTAAMNSAADQKLLADIKDIVSDLADEIDKNSDDIGQNDRELTRRTDLFEDLNDHRKETNKRLSDLERLIE